MRTQALLLSALLLGGALALVPAASADPACTTDLCPNPNEPPTCTPTARDYGTVKLTVSEDCSVDLVTGEDINCAGPWINKAEYGAGPVHWTSYTCGSPGGDPMCCASSAASASPDAIPPCQCAPVPWCRPIVELLAPGEGAVTYTLDEYCHATVTVDPTDYVDCVYGTHQVVGAGPVTVVVPVCSSPCGGLDYCPPPMMADPFPDCFAPCLPGPDACSLKEATPTTVGPLLIPFNPQAFVWGNDAGCDVDVDPIGACAPPSGSDLDRAVGPVHLHLLLCDGGIGDVLGPIQVEG